MTNLAHSPLIQPVSPVIRPTPMFSSPKRFGATERLHDRSAPLTPLTPLDDQLSPKSSGWTPSAGIRPEFPDPFQSDCEPVQSEPKSKLDRPYLIGVCGGTASGKTTVCALFEEYLKDEKIAFIPSDAFYKCLTDEQRKAANAGEYDFDHPDSIDWVGVKQCLRALKNGEPGTLPTYDFVTHSRTSEVKKIPSADVIILEGILIYSADQSLRDMMDLKIFVDCDADVRLARRLTRDIAERGRGLDGILTQYMKYVKPSYETFVDPSKRYADIIVPNLGNTINIIGVELLVQQIRHQMECRRKLTRKRSSGSPKENPEPVPVKENDEQGMGECGA